MRGENKKYLRHFIYFNIKKGKHIIQMQNHCTVYGESMIKDNVTKMILEFSCFRFFAEHYSTFRAVKVDSNQIKIILEKSQCYTMQWIANIIKIYKWSV